MHNLKNKMTKKINQYISRTFQGLNREKVYSKKKLNYVTHKSLF